MYKKKISQLLADFKQMTALVIFQEDDIQQRIECDSLLESDIVNGVEIKLAKARKDGAEYEEKGKNKFRGKNYSCCSPKMPLYTLLDHYLN